MFYKRNKQLFFTIPWNIFQKRFKNYKFESQITRVNAVKVYQETECKIVERGKDIEKSNKEKSKNGRKNGRKVTLGLYSQAIVK